MLFDFSERPLNADAYSDAPFTFLDPAAQNDLANITAISLIETGGRAARETWQNRRLTHLLRHAQARSAFWRKRLPSRLLTHGAMKFVPVLSRQELRAQTASEGALIPIDSKAPVMTSASTGSTGAPVAVYTSPENNYYTATRSLAQYFINGLPLDQNRTQIALASRLAELNDLRQAVETAGAWAGPLSKVFRTGTSKQITYKFDDAALIQELEKEPVGYLVCPSRYLDILMSKGGLDLIGRLGILAWVHHSDYRDPQIVTALAGIGVRSLSTYSAAEIGPIAFECASHQHYFHVAHSNVVVESDDKVTATQNGVTLTRLLVTHLHSYATPVIRYDLGDFGRLHHSCPCGHDGPTISDIFGRGKHFIRHPDGRYLPFYVSTETLQEIMPFSEIRFRQDQLDILDVEIGGRDSLTAEEQAALTAYLIRATDPAFKVRIKPVAQIDWSNNPKRLFFASSVA
jgi:phenylacetate-CoA ligase